MATKVKTSIERSRIIPEKMKDKIYRYLSSHSAYANGIVKDLKTPLSITRMLKKGDFCRLGADKKGFFVFTGRARSKSYSSPLKIPKKEVQFIGSTA